MILKKDIFQLKKKTKTGQERNILSLDQLAQKSHFYEQKFVLEELNKITSLIKKMEERISKIEKKLDE